MNKVKIIVDSTCDLGLDLLKKYDIDFLPLSVNFDEDSYKDLIDITVEELYSEVEKRGMLPKTAAVTIPEIMDCFKKYIDMGYDIVYTGISKQMSRSYENAVMVANEIAPERIFVVDSMNLSTGVGILALKACIDRDNGLSASEIAKRMEANRELVLTQFAIEQMDYLYKGGRCSSIQALLGSLVKLKPIIGVRNGKMSVIRKPIGKMKKALDEMVKQILKDKDNLDPEFVLITHSMADESCAYLHEVLSRELPDVNLMETRAGCVISSHCGRGTIGILYMLKEKK